MELVEAHSTRAQCASHVPRLASPKACAGNARFRNGRQTRGVGTGAWHKRLYDAFRPGADFSSLGASTRRGVEYAG